MRERPAWRTATTEEGEEEEDEEGRSSLQLLFSLLLLLSLPLLQQLLLPLAVAAVALFSAWAQLTQALGVLGLEGDDALEDGEGALVVLEKREGKLPEKPRRVREKGAGRERESFACRKLFVSLFIFISLSFSFSLSSLTCSRQRARAREYILGGRSELVGAERKRAMRADSAGGNDEDRTDDGDDDDDEDVMLTSNPRGHALAVRPRGASLSPHAQAMRHDAGASLRHGRSPRAQPGRHFLEGCEKANKRKRKEKKKWFHIPFEVVFFSFFTFHRGLSLAAATRLFPPLSALCATTTASAANHPAASHLVEEHLPGRQRR